MAGARRKWTATHDVYLPRLLQAPQRPQIRHDGGDPDGVQERVSQVSVCCVSYLA